MLSSITVEHPLGYCLVPTPSGVRVICWTEPSTWSKSSEGISPLRPKTCCRSQVPVSWGPADASEGMAVLKARVRPLALFPLRRSNARRWMDLGQAPRPPCVPACIARPTFSPPSLIRRRPVHLGRRRLDRVRRPVGRRRRERHPSGLSAQGAARGSNQAGAGERRGRPTVCDGVRTFSHLLVSMLLPVPPWGQQVHAAMASEIIDVTRPGCFNQVGGCEDSVVTWDDPNLGLASDLAA